MLFWPFSHERFSWRVVSVVDPLFTVPILILVVIAALRNKPMLARLALAWVGIYLTAGALQHRSAVVMGGEIAASRGHKPIRLEVKPSFGNIVVWKTIYETQDRYYVDAVRVGVRPRVFAGESVLKLDTQRDLSWLDLTSQQAIDIERFRWFSGDFLAQDPIHPNRIIDVRYSLMPNEVRALWSIEIAPDALSTTHARFLTHRNGSRENLGKLWRMVVTE
jgi:inner membrane protein